MGTTANIARDVQDQLSNYTYTFPFAKTVSDVTLNKCIISVIQDLFFTGGRGSFASYFEGRFPVHQGCNGNTS